MKKLLVLLVIPLCAGCFAWDMDDKPLPWMDDPVERPNIDKVVYYPGDPEPPPVPRSKDFRAYYEEGLHPEWHKPARMPVPAPPSMSDIPNDYAPPPSSVLSEGSLEGEIPCEIETRVETAPVAEKPADGKLEKRIEALESRIEQLLQELLKAQEKK